MRCNCNVFCDTKEAETDAPSSRLCKYPDEHREHLKDEEFRDFACYVNVCAVICTVFRRSVILLIVSVV